MSSNNMNDTTLTVGQVRELLKNIESLYTLYNLIGRGHVLKFQWCDAYITRHLMRSMSDE